MRLEGDAVSTAVELPQWDMSVIFPGLESPEFEEAFAQLKEKIEQLRVFFEEHGIDRRQPEPGDRDSVSLFETLVDRYNTLSAELTTVGAYIASFVSTDSRNDLAQALRSELAILFVDVSKLA